MEEKCVQSKEKMSKLFRLALSTYGKEISLSSVQHFSFDKIKNEENLIEGKHNYHIQYGFPQSGCISIKFSYLEASKTFSIDEFEVYAPPADKIFAVANFSPQSDNFGEFSIRANFGIDMNTKKHTSLVEVESNPNALKILDMAINDLKQAKILGECRVAVPIGSDRIPVCDAINQPLNEAKR